MSTSSSNNGADSVIKQYHTAICVGQKLTILTVHNSCIWWRRKRSVQF